VRKIFIRTSGEKITFRVAGQADVADVTATARTELAGE
jgi:hypothetical protein